MKPDNRFSIAAKLYKAGYLNDLDDLFEAVPRSVVARHLGFNNQRIVNLHQHPARWVLIDLIILGNLIDIDQRGILNIVLNQLDKNSKRKVDTS